MSYTLDQLYGIRDQVIVVTGAAGGIGLELCRAIRDLGGRVAAVVRNSKSREKVLEALHCPNLSTEKDAGMKSPNAPLYCNANAPCTSRR